MPVAWWRLAVVRMAPFAPTIAHRAGDDLAVLRLKNRVRGWNGDRQDPVHDARWALDRIRHVLPGMPVVLVGHSMGGRVALRLGAEPDVVGVAALAPWVESDARRRRAPARRSCSCTAAATASPTRGAPTSWPRASPTAVSTCAT